ncbi:MAG: hypothetical protein KDM63_01660 [Verrucomicrobiae bacterium]|nr:hypothetical protein [Verrucomicrobiae bacterium]
MSPHAGWMLLEEIAPRLKAASSYLPKVGADDAEELLQDGMAIAARLLDSAERQGKQVAASSIAYYTLCQLRTGRRSTYGGRADVLSPAAQLDGRSHLTSVEAEMNDPETGESISLGEALACNDEDPSLAAARNLDWLSFLQAEDPMTGLMIGAFARGDTMRDLKEVTGLSDSGISSRKRQMAARLLEHFGADSIKTCIADAGRDPSWMADLIAEREFEACQHRPMFSPL